MNEAIDVRRRILRCLGAEGFSSGERLGLAAGISRAAVWKHIRALRAAGLEIEAVRGRGYRLRRAVEWLDRMAVLEAMDPAPRDRLRGLDLLLETDSTNSCMLRHAAAGGEAPWACLAEWQRAGRGRRGRSWYSPAGGNVYLSVLERWPAGMVALQGLGPAVAVEAARALADCGIRVGWKWPNDLWCGARKCGGVLIEARGEMEGPCEVIVGIGINTAMPAAADAHIDQPWTVAGVPEQPTAACSRNRLAGRLLGRIVDLLQHFPRRGFGPWREIWPGGDVLREREVRIEGPGGIREGRVVGIGAAGELLLRRGGRVESVHSGEVTVRPAW